MGKKARERCGWLGGVLGSVATKQQARVHHAQDSDVMGSACQALLPHWAALAASTCDGVVTDGPGVGCERVEAKLGAIGDACPVVLLAGGEPPAAGAFSTGGASLGDET